MIKILFISALFSVKAFGGDIRAPYDLDSATILPKGNGSSKFKTIFMSLEDRFTETGNTEPLGAALNRPVKWSDLVNSRASAERRALLGAMIDSNPDLTSGTEGPGQVVGQVTSAARVMVPSLSYGLSEEVSVGFGIPIYHVSINADAGFTKAAHGQAWLDRMCQQSYQQCVVARDALNSPVSSKLQANGYLPLSNREIDAIGDVRVGSKWKFYSDSEITLALKNDLNLPTGRVADVDRLIDAGTGDGQLDVGAGLVAEKQVMRRMKAVASVGYLAQLPDRIEKRIPVTGADPFTSDKEVVQRDLGDSVNAGLALVYDVPKTGVVLGAGYNFQFQNEAEYKGARFAAGRYQALSAQTPHQLLHSSTFLAGFSTVEWYRGGDFFAPLQANLTFSKPWAGRNTTTNDVWSAEMVLFF